MKARLDLASEKKLYHGLLENVLKEGNEGYRRGVFTSNGVEKGVLDQSPGLQITISHSGL